MASKNSTIISFTISFIIILFLFITLAEADNFGTCPSNPLQLGVCANVLNLANVVAGDPRARPCCSAISGLGLADIQVADCLCYVFRPLPLVFTIDKAVREIFFACNKVFPIGFQCPPAPTVITP